MLDCAFYLSLQLSVVLIYYLGETELTLEAFVLSDPLLLEGERAIFSKLLKSCWLKDGS